MSATTHEEVRAAAEAMMDSGIEPTPTEIRRRIGRGSFTTIGQILRDLKAERDSRTRDGIQIPPEIEARVDDVMRSIWVAALAETRKETDAVCEAAKADVARIAAANLEASTEIGRLERVETDLRSQLETARSEIAQRDVRIAVFENESARMHQEIGTLKAQIDAARDENLKQTMLLGRNEGELVAMRQQLAAKTR